MHNDLIESNEQLVAKAFSHQAAIFDGLCTENSLVEYKRQRVRQHVGQYLYSPSGILELNCGTGEDAVWFAQQGHQVHATDLSQGMLDILKNKISIYGYHKRITAEQCSFTNLAELQNKGPYDMIFSNFAGLNCTGRLKDVLRSLESLVRPGGIITLVVLPPFCLWESLFIFRGKLKTASRRIFAGKKGARAKVEGHFFTTWYYSPSYIQKALGDKYETIDLEGLCTLVPPSYLEHFNERYPSLSQYLKKKETILKNKWPWKYIGDYYIISLKKK